MRRRHAPSGLHRRGSCRPRAGARRRRDAAAAARPARHVRRLGDHAGVDPAHARGRPHVLRRLEASALRRHHRGLDRCGRHPRRW
ncbi:MAG: hypothetical protein FJ284_02620 [Planctomycetes bacterium]|nr:hypothetical protein [Planctomycetota bacterium]